MIQATSQVSVRDQAPPFSREDLVHYPGAPLDFDDIHHVDAAANRTADNWVTHAGQSFAYHRPVGASLRSRYHVNELTKPRSGDFRLTVLQQCLPHKQQGPLVAATMTLVLRDER
jgi:hypothetical protein